MGKGSILIKGIREGLLATFNDGEWSDLSVALITQVGENTNFFQGARLALDVANRELHAVELGALRDSLRDRGVTLWAVLTTCPVTEITVQVLGMTGSLSTAQLNPQSTSPDTSIQGDHGVFLQRSLRPGFTLESNDHVTILGDVALGAEVAAGGSIIVWGRVYGAVHAGTTGDTKATINALALTPGRLSIAGREGKYNQRWGKPRPMTASLHNGVIVFENWILKR